MRKAWIALVLQGALACGGQSHDPDPLVPDGGVDCSGDYDCDGFGPPLDCDDRDPEIGPAINEGYCCSTNLDDGQDNDCDGEVDEKPPLVGCVCDQDDADRDGYLDDFDCAPEDATVNPGIQEGQGCSIGLRDDKDNDCDDEVDEVIVQCDADYDGWADTEDCDDLLYYVNPGVSENCCFCNDGTYEARAGQCNRVDDDCDGDVDESPACDCDAIDRDYDGYRAGDDCDDTSSEVSPGVVEYCCPGVNDYLCNEIDDDCDGEVDEGDSLVCERGQQG